MLGGRSLNPKPGLLHGSERSVTGFVKSQYCDYHVQDSPIHSRNTT